MGGVRSERSGWCEGRARGGREERDIHSRVPTSRGTRQFFGGRGSGARAGADADVPRGERVGAQDGGEGRGVARGGVSVRRRLHHRARGGGRRASGAGRAPARGGGPAARSRPPRREVFEREATRREGVATDRATRGEAVAAKPLERARRRRPARRARGGPRRRAEAPRARRDAPRPKPTHVSISPARDREGRREDAAAREHADRGTRRARDRPNAGSCRDERRGSLRARACPRVRVRVWARSVTFERFQRLMSREC
jgi:hypothetical protein